MLQRIITLLLSIFFALSCFTGSSQIDSANESNSHQSINGNITCSANNDSIYKIPEYITIQGRRFDTALTKLRLTFASLENSDIELLKYMKNLTELSLIGNRISDISPLSGLTNLTDLALGGNRISDISPLSGLTNLKTLNLNLNEISDISTLSGLTNLTRLSLSENPLGDISPLKNLTNLIDLQLIDSGLSEEQQRELRAALPGCTILFRIPFEERR